MLSIGEKFPEFNKKSVVSIEKGKEFVNITSEDHKKAGKWLVIFWYPRDFTQVCPTEIKEFNNLYEAFNEREAMVIGASTDTEYSHLAWLKIHEDLNDLKFPLLADTSKSLGEDLGILDADEKVANRVTYIIDPDGIIKWVCANHHNVGRNVDEVIRVLDALQTDELCPCNWKKGDETIAV
jgi:peroxiredoxin (alkyl hydroperoxide reductase subunit C)